MTPEISERAKNLGTETAFVVSAEVNELKKKGIYPIELHIGDPDFVTPENIRGAAIKALNEGKTHYTASAGIPELKEAIANYLSKSRGIHVDPKHVVTGPGSKFVIFGAVAASTDHGVGHEILYPNPGYPVYTADVEFLGVKAIPYILHEKNDFRVDIDELKDKINENTRLLILNYPHNPTGSTLTEKDLKQISDIVLPNPRVRVLADEIYSRILYEGEFKSIASIPEMQERTIILDGFSKTYAMTGWRLGYGTIRDEGVINTFTKLSTDLFACATSFVQHAGIEALNGPQDAAKEMVETFKERRDIIVEGLNDIPGVTCKQPKGAFYAWANVTDACKRVGVADAEELRKELLYKAGVAVTADIHFGQKIQGYDYIRLSYAAANDVIRRGLRRIENYGAEHSK